MLEVGAKLGQYELLGFLGAGGMGEVYRARDPRLHREVAIKILPAGFAADAERLRRFEQEARGASALNHPNVLTIYDVGTHDGTPFLVMELLQGETLRQRLSTGPQPLRKSVDWATQIAQGLAATHDAGILHRDLKPENIFLAKDGRVKILDFGLAKLTAAADASGDLTTLDHTEPGMLLGTAGYMAPEQVRGGRTDPRSDIFSFGTILYEMLSGRRAFQRDSFAETAAAILTADPPDLTELHHPAALNRIVMHCLEKEPDQRFQSARDLAFHLQSLSLSSESGAGGFEPFVKPAQVLRRWKRDGLLWAVLALTMANLVIMGWWVHDQRLRRATRSMVQFERLTDFSGLNEFPAIAPDEKSVAFTSDTSGKRQIWIRLMAGGAPLEITHENADHLYPRWSHDSGSIIYYSPAQPGEPQGTLWEVSALGGVPHRLASSLSDGDISHDGTKLAFFQLNNNQVQLVVSDRDGSNARPIIQAQPSFEYIHPRWAPDDTQIAYQHSTNMWAYDIFIVNARGGSARQLTHESDLMSGMAWMRDASGIIYSGARNSTIFYLPTMHLWAQSLNASAGPQQLTFGEDSYEGPDIGASGKLLASYQHMQSDIWKFPTTGRPAENVRQGVRLTRQTGQVQTPTLSPDASEMAYLSDSGGHANIWVVRLDNSQLRQLTYEHDPNVSIGVPLWSPDGKAIAYARVTHVTNNTEYVLVNTDGSNPRVLVTGAWATWSPDGRWLYYTLEAPTRAASASPMYKISRDGGEPILVRTEYCRGPAVGPDGETVYYVTPQQNVSGALDYELRVAHPETGPSRLLFHFPGIRVPTWQGLHPVLSHNGKWLAMPLNDNFGTNVWLAATAGNELRAVTDFGERRTFIVRRLAWSPDDRAIYAAVGEGEAGVVLLDGLSPYK